jgi:PAS domain S-box-containing protein
MDNGQASVDEQRCIACGTCIRECPQGAKTYRNDLEKCIKLLKEHPKVAVSIAPSFAALFSDWERKRLPSALRYLGFSYVGETVIGAQHVAAESLRQHAGQQQSLCTACPAFVSLVEKYYPHLVDKLLPVASPLVAHARLIKENQGNDCKVVFIGPCVAKKAEADRIEDGRLIDVVLTFAELQEWFTRLDLHLDRLEASSFDQEPAGESRLFALPGGLTRTAHVGSDSLAADIIAVSGIKDIENLLQNWPEDENSLLAEPLFCSQGCINGPGRPDNRKLFTGRNSLISYATQNPGCKTDINCPDISAGFVAQPQANDRQISENEIKKVLAATGKESESDQLDCGACGYDSCRDKAIAVIQGLAEVEMCIPYMRRLAEQRTDRIIETSPNGIVMLDEKLQIISMNPAFRKMFLCSEAVIGRHISYLLEPQPFEKILTGSETLIEETVNHEKYSLTAHQIIYSLPAEKQLVGIFVNITGSKKSQEHLDKLRQNLVNQARDMLAHQVQMSQELARYLGESTAQGEVLIDNLLTLAAAEQKSSKKEGSAWDIFTSK